MNILQILIVMVLIESVVETIKPVYDKEKGFNKDALIALGVSELICVLTGIDLFKLVGAPVVIPYMDSALGAGVGGIVGSVLTGVIGSRGANAVHDLLKKLNLIASGGGSATAVLGMMAGAAKTPKTLPPTPPPPGHGGGDPTV